VISPRRLGSGGWNGGIGSAGIRRLALRSVLRHWLVAMRYSQERSDDRSWNPASPRQAASIVSCSMSSASVSEPIIR
jgi:hypothetical protein